MQNASDKQRGNIVVYIVVGVVLAALLGGAIYASKQQGRIASRTDSVATNDQKTDDTATEKPQNDTTKDDDSKESPAAPSTTQPSTPSNPSTSTPASNSQSSSTVPSTGPSHIASTGPEDTLVPGVGLALLAAGTLSYRRSSRAYRVQALKQ